MIKSGIIVKDEIREISNNDLIFYLLNLVNENEDIKNSLEIYKQSCLFWQYSSIIEFFVKTLDYVIIYNDTIYFQSETNNINKIEYIKNGYRLNKLPKLIFKNGKFEKYVNSIQQQIEMVGFEHSMNSENNLSFWYPKTADIGFKTPNTIITNFSKEENNLIKSLKWNEINEKELLKRIEHINQEKAKLDLTKEIFIRLGNTSNKFNFNSCHLNNINDLYKKLMILFEDLYFRLEWQESIELVLREYIKPRYERNRIYNGMPLNTEFRIFYDFDEKKILGIFNYWDKDTMLDNLRDYHDLVTFANTTEQIESDFKFLSPQLLEEVNINMPNADLKGKWSVDFLYDGKDFVLIDMAHAECSYYYEKVLQKQYGVKL